MRDESKRRGWMRDHRYFYGGIVEKYSSTEAGFVYFEAGCGIVKIGGMRDENQKITGYGRDAKKSG